MLRVTKISIQTGSLVPKQFAQPPLVPPRKRRDHAKETYGNDASRDPILARSFNGAPTVAAEVDVRIGGIGLDPITDRDLSLCQSTIHSYEPACPISLP